jgi:hypothetical protein
MACFGKGLAPRTGSAFQADALGNQLVKAPPKRGAPGIALSAGAACCTPTCSAYAFEQLTIPGFLATNPVAAPDAYLPIRIVDAVQTLHGVASVGSALSTATWQTEGFILLGSERSCARSAVLSASTAIGACYLNAPTALVVDPADGSLVIVGTGYIVNLAGEASATMPAVARVHPGSMSVFVQVGNGDTLPDEQYADIVLSPACAAAPGFIVCGSATVDGVATACVRILSPATLLPLPIATTGVPYTLLTDAALYGAYVFDASAAVCLDASDTLGMVVVGVRATISNDGLIPATSSLLWSLRLDGTPLTPLSVTSFNSMSTFFLATPANVYTLGIVAVRISAGGTTYAVSSGASSPGAALPPYVTVVHAFNTDTIPIESFGTSGIAMWFDPQALSSLPVSATLSGFDGSILVTGTSFTPTAAASTPLTAIYPPQQSYLQVDVPATSSYALGAVTTPFLLRLNCAGAACQLLSVPCNPCATFMWATIFVFTAPLQGVLLGDCAIKPLAYGQPSLVLALSLAVSQGVARCLNGVRMAQPAVGGADACDGVVAVDAHCAPTVMVVNGPLVVGDAAVEPTLPGAIRFRDGRFSGYNGTEWVYLDCCPPP